VALFVYVDNSNVWIEGMRVSAVRKHMAPDLYAAMNDDIKDHDWSYDFGKLYRAVCPAEAQIGRSSLFGSRPPQNDHLWEMARQEGFEVSVFDRNVANKEKEVDVAIATQIIEDSFLYMKPERSDKVVLLSGDRDYLPTVKSLKARGLKTLVVFWKHATSHDLRAEADDFFALDGVFEAITRG
jgi:hypothetical protein